MTELKSLIVKYELFGDNLPKIVDFYNSQRSEEVIEDIEKEIDQSFESERIYSAIDQSYLVGFDSIGKLSNRCEEALMSSTVAAINELVQKQLALLGWQEVTAIDAAKWVTRAGLLKDPGGKQLRHMLRHKMGIVGADQRPPVPNGRWYIRRVR